MKRSIALLAAASLGMLWIAAPARADVGDLTLVADTGEGDYGEVDGREHRPAISADGRFIAYVPQGEFEGDPLFLRDMRRGASVPIVTDRRNDTAAPVLSDSGRYLAFASGDPNLSREDTDRDRGSWDHSQINDIFVYDRRTRSFTLASRRSGRHGRASRNNSSTPSISGDGSVVAYGTESDNLAPRGKLIIGGVYARNLRTERNRLVAGVPGIDFWTPSSGSPDISGDGRRVAYVFQYSREPFDPQHEPANLRRWFHRRHKQIMLWDAGWAKPRVVSRASGRHGAIADENCSRASVSASGRFVAFVSEADNLVPGDDNATVDVFVRDVRRNVTTLVSRVGLHGALGDGESTRPSISADGRYVAFQSLADNLAPGDTDDRSDIYVKDLRSGRLTLVARGLGGEPSNGRFGYPVITPDGRYVAFGSTSSNISPEVATHDLAFYRFQLLP